MPTAAQLLPIGMSLMAVCCWGTSDFIGGSASKQSDAFRVTLCAHASGTALAVVFAVLTHASVPARSSQLWAFTAGSVGGVALAIFYRALASGKMGLTAPIAALLGAGIPTVFGMVSQGLPGALPIAGFLLAGLGIWLISRPEQNLGRPKGLPMAIVSGIGFATFMLCIHRTGGSSAWWSASFSRFASFVAVGLIVVFSRVTTGLRRHDALLGLGAGCLDVTGTVLFIRAQQIGRLDAAVVITSLYPAVTVLLARLILREHFSRWKAVGIAAALAAVPLIAVQ